MSEYVYIAERSSTNIAHTNRECHYLQYGGEIAVIPEAEAEYTRICETCKYHELPALD